MKSWGEVSPVRQHEIVGAAQDYIVELFFELAVARVLQLDRQIDIKLFRSAIAGTSACNPKVSGKITAYRKAEAVAGEVAGKDEKGYPYKRWKLSKPELAAQILRERQIRPLKSSAIKIIKERDHR